MIMTRKQELNRSSALVAVALLIVAISVATGFSDIGDRVTITLKSGATYTGTIVAESASEISILSEPDKIKVTIPKDFIIEIKLLEPKREDKTETQAPETPLNASQFMASLSISNFSLRIAKDRVWGLIGYARVSSPRFLGFSLGIGYGYAKTSEVTFYQGIHISGNLSQNLMFLAIGRGSKQNTSVLLGTYSASSDLQGRMELEPDCLVYRCYKRWTEAQISGSIQGNVFGFVYDSDSSQFVVVSGLWVVFNSTMIARTFLRACHEILGCSLDTVITDDQKPGLIYGILFGLGLKW